MAILTPKLIQRQKQRLSYHRQSY